MSVIDEIRDDREELARVVERHEGIREIVEQLYPDKAHFIYELLQNAEDAGATFTSFEPFTDKLVFTHNGERPFEDKDVGAITDIGKGTKSDDDQTIGKFGIGFKAVFTYSETPKVWSPKHSFEIKQLVLPYELDQRPDLGNNTQFEFPFNNPKKSPKNAFEEIIFGLDGLNSQTLLFLQNIKEIKWRIEGGKSYKIYKECYNNLVTIKKLVAENIEEQASYLLYFDNYDNSKLYTAVAYELAHLDELNLDIDGVGQNFKVTQAEKGTVCIFFKAEKETSNLKFHIHAPFSSGPDRSSVKDLPVNNELFKKVADLVVTSLYKVKEEGLLTKSFLRVLPNNEDDLPSLNYERIRSAIIGEMQEKDLVPTLDGDYRPGKNLIRCGEKLRELIDLSDVPYVMDVEEQPYWWSIIGKNGSRVSDILSSIGVKQLMFDDFFGFLESNAKTGWYSEYKNERFIDWISRKSLRWHYLLYRNLENNIPKDFRASCREGHYSQMLLCRLKTGDYRKGQECFFPTDVINDEKRFPQVDPETYNVDLKEGEENLARNFLSRIGVKEAGEEECIKEIITEVYLADEPGVSFQEHCQHLDRFVKFFGSLTNKESNSYRLNAQDRVKKISEIFDEAKLVFCKSGKYSQPSEAYYCEHDVHRRYLEISNTPDNEISDVYFVEDIDKKKSSRWIMFFKLLGLRSSIEIHKKNNFWGNKELKLSNGRPSEYEVRVDFEIENLIEFLVGISSDDAEYLWGILTSDQSIRNKWWHGIHRANKSYSASCFPSVLAQHLRDHEWVPQEEGGVVKPCFASFSKLPAGCKFDKGWDWIEVVAFGSELAEDEKEINERRQKAEELGFDSDESLKVAEEFDSCDDLEKKEVLNLLKSIRAKKRRTKSDLPPGYDSAGNRERRSSKIKERAEGAVERKTEKRTRSVPVGREDVKDDAKPYLKSCYTNIDEIQLCQVCEEELPFKVNHEYYFETVEILPHLKRRHRENYLCLCPNHAAMYMHALKEKSEEVEARLISHVDNYFPIELAGEQINIFFHLKHLEDLKDVIIIDRNYRNSE